MSKADSDDLSAKFRAISAAPSLAEFIAAVRPSKGDSAALMAILDNLSDRNVNYLSWQKAQALLQQEKEEPDAHITVSSVLDFRMREINRQLRISGVAKGRLRAEFSPEARAAFEKRMFPDGAPAPDMMQEAFNKQVLNPLSSRVMQDIEEVEAYAAKFPDAAIRIDLGAGGALVFRLYSPGFAPENTDLLAPARAVFGKKKALAL